MKRKPNKHIVALMKVINESKMPPHLMQQSKTILAYIETYIK